MGLKKISIVLFLALISLGVFARGDRVIGVWLTENQDSRVEIYKTPSGTFEGKLVWLEEPLDEDGKPKLDKENPERSKRTRPLLGTVLLKDFTWDAGAGEWKNGTIYDPENGRTYSAFMRLENNNTLKIRGFVMGMRFLGRSTTWTRERDVRE